MAIDNSHITKLGELKQLIDGLWSKVTTAISNAVSGLLSKSEAAETYATKGEIPSTDNFATKDGSNATGTWGISVTGNAATASSVSHSSVYEGYLELSPTATTLSDFMANCDTVGSLMNALYTKTSSDIFVNSNERYGVFSGRLNLSSNTTLRDLIGCNSYPGFQLWISRQVGFFILESSSTYNNVFGVVTGQKPSISYLRNVSHSTLNTAIGSSSQPVFVGKNGVITPCDYMTKIVFTSSIVTSSMVNDVLYVI